MSTFHKSTLLNFKQQNREAARKIPKEELETLLLNVNKLAIPALQLEEYVLRYVPAIRLFTNDSDKLFFTTTILALKTVLENELTVRQIEQDTLFPE